MVGVGVPVEDGTAVEVERRKAEVEGGTVVEGEGVE